MKKIFKKNTFKVFSHDFKKNCPTTQDKVKSETLKETVYNDPYLNKNDRKILFYLIAVVEKQYFSLGLNYARVKQSTIARKQKLSIDQVKRAISKLKTHGYITINRINKINLYFINFNKFAPESPLNRTSPAPESHLKNSQKSFQEGISKNPYNNYNFSNNYNEQQQDKSSQKVKSQNEEKSVVVFSESVLERTDKHGFERKIIFGMIKRHGIKTVSYTLSGILHSIENLKILPNEVNRFFIAALRDKYRFDQYEKYTQRKEQEKKREKQEREKLEKERIEYEQSEREYEKKEKIFMLLSTEEQKKLIQKTRDEFSGSHLLNDQTIKKLAIDKLPDDYVLKEKMYEKEKRK